MKDCIECTEVTLMEVLLGSKGVQSGLSTLESTYDCVY